MAKFSPDLVAFLAVLALAVAACSQTPAAAVAPGGVGVTPTFKADAGSGKDGAGADSTKGDVKPDSKALDITILDVEDDAAADQDVDDAITDEDAATDEDTGTEDTGEDDIGPVDAGPSCGDKTCGGGETCKTCAKDCGACPAVCGDKTCNGSETCTTCPGDCGKCATGCGNGTCEAATETCENCAKDCGACPCNPLTSETCLADEQCYPVTKGTVCAEPGTVAKSQVCGGDADCAKGLLCIGSVCRPICDTTGATPAAPCASPAKCLEITYSDGKPLGVNLGVCVGGDTCNVLTNVGCASSLMCGLAGAGKACVTAGTQGDNLPCDKQTCDGEHICVSDGAGSPQLCKRKCNTKGGAPACPASGKCGVVTTGDPPKSAPDSLGACP